MNWGIISASRISHRMIQAIQEVGKDTVHAVASRPDETFIAEGYLYFCAKDPESGELHFSRTLQEHEQAVSIYAPLWRAYDAERGIE